MEAEHGCERRRARQRDDRLLRPWLRPWREVQLTQLLAALLAARRLLLGPLLGERAERGGLAIAAEAFVLLLEPLVLLLEERVLALELDPAIEKQGEGGGRGTRARPGLDAAQWGARGGQVVGVGGKKRGLRSERVDRAGCAQAGSLDLRLESPCCSYFSWRTRCTVGSAATLAESSSRSKSDCESDIIHGVASVSAWSLDKSSLIKLHASSSCSFVTTGLDLHSAVELAKDTAAVPTPTATGAARFTTCIL